MMRLFQSEQRLASSVLGYVEVASALARQQAPRKLDEQKLLQLREELEEDWNNLTGLRLTDELVKRAVSLTGSNLRPW